MINEQPYPGLRSFQQGETKIFFGREDQVDHMVECLEQSRILSVIGPSGSGKSSLVYAGLLSALKSGFMGSAGARWLIADMRPGNRPMLRLADALLAVSGQERYEHDSDFLKATLERGENSFSDYLEKEQWLGKDENLLILVDQFEELFRFAPREGQEEAETFVVSLLRAIHLEKYAVYVVITMRSDFIGDCARFEGLPEAVSHSQFLTPRLTREQSQEAIEGPASVFNGSVEKPLINTLLNDMGTDPDQLPLMQHVLMRMWNSAEKKAAEKQGSIILTLEDYKAVGGLKEALSRHADNTYAELSKPEQAVAKTLFCLLTERGVDQRDTRRPTSFGTIVKVVSGDKGTEEAQQLVKAVAAVFRREDNSFLMPKPNVELDDARVLDISHESLIRQWKTLNEWVEQEAKSAESYKRLERDAQDWKQYGTGLREAPRLDVELQWRQKIAPTKEWAERYGGDFLLAMEFLEASEKKREDDQRIVEEDRQRELKQAKTLAEEQKKRAEIEKQGVQRFKRLTVILAFITLFAIGAVFYAFNQQQIAESALIEAQQAEMKAHESQQTAEKALIETQKAKAETENALELAQKAGEQAIIARDEAEQERNVARQARQAAEAALIEAQKAKAETEDALETAQKAEEKAKQAAIQAEKSEAQRTQELFASQLTHASLLAQNEDYMAAKSVLTESRALDPQISLERRHARDFLIRFVDIMGDSAQQIYQGAGAALHSVAVSPDGRWLAAVGEKGTVVLFDVESGEIHQRLIGHQGHVWDVVFDPKGKWLITGGDDQTIIRWSLPSRNKPAEMLHRWKASYQVLALGINPDGTQLAGGGIYGNEKKPVTLWNPIRGQLDRELGHTYITGLTFSQSGKKLATVSYDRTARIWDVATGKRLKVLRGHTETVRGVAFSSDEQLIATSSEDRRVMLWEVNSDKPRKVFTGHKNYGSGLGFIDTSQITKPVRSVPLLVSASRDRTLRVWDTGGGAALRVLQGHHAGIGGIAIQAPSKTEMRTQVFSASSDGTVRRWEIATLPYQYLIDIPEKSRSTAISPDGQWVAVGFQNGSLHVYRLPEGHLVTKQTKAHAHSIKRLRFNDNSEWLASASFDHTAKLWAIAPDGSITEKQIFQGHTQEVHSLAFSSDRQTLATASFDGQVGLFTIGTETKRFFRPYDRGRIVSVDFHSSRNHLLIVGDRELSLWDLNSDLTESIKTFPSAEDDLLWAAFSPNGQSVASVGREHVVKVYSTQGDQQKHQLVGHEQAVWRVNFSPDSQQLATVSSDATVRLWDLAVGRELFTLGLPTEKSPPTPLWDFDFRCTPTGCWLAVPLVRGKLALYHLGDYAREEE